MASPALTLITFRGAGAVTLELQPSAGAMNLRWPLGRHEFDTPSVGGGHAFHGEPQKAFRGNKISLPFPIAAT